MKGHVCLLAAKENALKKGKIWHKSKRETMFQKRCEKFVKSA